MPWTPKTTENRLLEAYSVKERARIFAEVPFVGKTAHGVAAWQESGERRFDGVRFEESRGRASVVLYRDSETECLRLLGTKSATIIEVKRKLNRGVIGQIIAGRDLFKKQFKRSPARSVIVCEKSDPALEWVCDKYKIDVVVIPAGELRGTKTRRPRKSPPKASRQG